MRALKLEPTITSRDSDSVSRYLGEIGRIPLINVAEEVSLSQQIRKGDQAALEYLVRTNLKFVVSVAKNYQHRGLSLGDLINEGNLGLIRAASRFDETKGFKFISFAVWWIRQAIIEALAEHTRLIRLPHHLVNAISKLNKAAAELEQQLERRPTNDEIALAAQLDQPKVTDHLKNARKCKSLDEIVNTEIGSTLLDVLDAENPGKFQLLPFEFDEGVLNDIMQPLSVRERKILFLYFGLAGLEPRSLEEIGRVLALSRERCRQLKDQGIKKIRMYINRRHLSI